MLPSGALRDAADKVARAEAAAVIQRWNEQLAVGRDMLWSPTIRAAMLAWQRAPRLRGHGCGRHLHQKPHLRLAARSMR
jgi:hypothetical protein